jgi:hypothetical protein
MFLSQNPLHLGILNSNSIVDRKLADEKKINEQNLYKNIVGAGHNDGEHSDSVDFGSDSSEWSQLNEAEPGQISPNDTSVIADENFFTSQKQDFGDFDHKNVIFLIENFLGGKG